MVQGPRALRPKDLYLIYRNCRTTVPTTSPTTGPAAGPTVMVWSADADATAGGTAGVAIAVGVAALLVIVALFFKCRTTSAAAATPAWCHTAACFSLAWYLGLL